MQNSIRFFLCSKFSPTACLVLRDLTYLPTLSAQMYRCRYYYYYYYNIIYSYPLLVGYQTISLSNSFLSYSSVPPTSPLSLPLTFSLFPSHLLSAWAFLLLFCFSLLDFFLTEERWLYDLSSRF